MDSKRYEDPAINEEFWAVLKKALVLTWDCVPYAVTLDRPVQISKLELVDCPQASCPAMAAITHYP